MIAIRKARPGEGVVVARRIKESLPLSIEGLTIWHCSRVDHWVEMHLAAPGTSIFYVAADEHAEVIVAAEFRTSNDTVFLNQVGVIPSRQGEGIGRRLLAAGLRELSQREGVASLALDVETANERADAWYRRLGLSPVSRTYWTLTAPRPRGAAPAPVRDWEQAEQAHARFGFSRFQIHTAGGLFAVGRLADSLFRLTSDQVWRDPAVHAALDRIDARRRLLLISESRIGGSLIGEAQPVLQTEHLTGPIKPILAKLPTP